MYVIISIPLSLWRYFVSFRSEILVENGDFVILSAFDAPVTGVITVVILSWVRKTGIVTVWLHDGEKKLEDKFIRFDTIRERDRQTDRQTDRHRTTALAALMHDRAAIKCSKIAR